MWFDSATRKYNMDWRKCALCQKDDVNLADPSQNKNLKTCGYSILAANIDAFRQESLPLSRKLTVEISNLHGECGIGGNLQYMQAKWHKSCALEVSSSRLQRTLAARERSYKGTDGATPAKLI